MLQMLIWGCFIFCLTPSCHLAFNWTLSNFSIEPNNIPNLIKPHPTLTLSQTYSNSIQPDCGSEPYLAKPFSTLSNPTSYDQFPKITISCPNIRISAKYHTLIIYPKWPSVTPGTPGASKMGIIWSFSQDYHKLSKYPYIQQKNIHWSFSQNYHKLPEVPPGAL